MGKLGGWKQTVLVVATAPVIVGLAFGGAAVAESYSVSVPARTVRVEAQQVDAPRADLPTPVRLQRTDYSAIAEECVESVCVKGVAVTTPGVELSSVGGRAQSPVVELSTGQLAISADISPGSLALALSYGAVGLGLEISPSDLPD